MKANIKECQFACHADTYNGHAVQQNAATNVENPRFGEWNPSIWKAGEQVQVHVQAGCQLQVFNDGKELPKLPRINGQVNITCFGPDSPHCPAKKGYELKPVTVSGTQTEVARKKKE
jgi:hypothetical protein